MRAVVGAVLAGVLCCGAAACQASGDPESSTASAPVAVSESWREDVASAVSEALGCDRQWPLQEDMYFWDRATGLDCLHGGSGNLSSAFVYENGGSARQALTDVGHVIAPDQPAVVSDHVLVIVREDSRVAQVRSAIPEKSVVLDALPPEQPLTVRQEAIGSCVGSVASSLSSVLEDSPEPESDLRELDRIYSGYSSLLAQMRASSDFERARSAATKDPDSLESGISMVGAGGKGWCERVIEKKLER